jgi:hypothetical protein
MKTTSAVIYIIDEKDIPLFEKLLQQEDEEAYRKHGPYFQNHEGRYYLVHDGDVGWRVRALLTGITDALGGIELTGTKKHMQAYTCLLDSEECYSCFLGDRRLLLVPKPAALMNFVQWMQKWVGMQNTGDELRQALWEVGARFSLEVVGTPEEGFTQIETPFLMPDGDVIDLYYRREGEATILLTDLGETLAWLSMQHADPHLPETVHTWVADICSSLGIEQSKGMLIVRVAAPESLADDLLRLAQGVVRIASLHILLRERASDA